MSFRIVMAASSSRTPPACSHVRLALPIRALARRPPVAAVRDTHVNRDVRRDPPLAGVVGCHVGPVVGIRGCRRRARRTRQAVKPFVRSHRQLASTVARFKLIRSCARSRIISVTTATAFRTRRAAQEHGSVSSCGPTTGRLIPRGRDSGRSTMRDPNHRPFIGAFIASAVALTALAGAALSQTPLDPQSLVGVWSGTWINKQLQGATGRYHLTIEQVKARQGPRASRISGRGPLNSKWSAHLMATDSRSANRTRRSF